METFEALESMLFSFETACGSGTRELKWDAAVGTEGNGPSLVTYSESMGGMMTLLKLGTTIVKSSAAFVGLVSAELTFFDELALGVSVNGLLTFFGASLTALAAKPGVFGLLFAGLGAGLL